MHTGVFQTVIRKYIEIVKVTKYIFFLTGSESNELSTDKGPSSVSFNQAEPSHQDIKPGRLTFQQNVRGWNLYQTWQIAFLSIGGEEGGGDITSHTAAKRRTAVECVGTSAGIFCGAQKRQFFTVRRTISSRYCGDQHTNCKSNHVFFTLTKCFLCLNLSRA